MQKKKSVVIIGSGNVATHLSLRLFKQGLQILQVYSPSLKNATLLAKKLKCKATSSLSEINQNADIYILAIKDDALFKINKKLHLYNKTVIHTSGSVDISVLKNISNNYGVLYPLQTFSKNIPVSFENVPVFIEASNIKTYRSISALAKKVGKNIYKADSVTRKLIHIAAVFACNFNNYFFTIAEDLLNSKKIPFKVLHPLIAETYKKAASQGPSYSQTGPAVRNDKRILREHYTLLASNKEYQKIYSIISRAILKSKFRKNSKFDYAKF